MLWLGLHLSELARVVSSGNARVVEDRVHIEWRKESDIICRKVEQMSMDICIYTQQPMSNSLDRRKPSIVTLLRTYVLSFRLE